MTKAMKSQAKFRTVPQIANLVPAVALGRALTPTPLCGPALAPARATPGGASPRHSLCPPVRPHAALSGQTGGAK